MQLFGRLAVLETHTLRHQSVRILLHFTQFCIRRQVRHPPYGPWEHVPPQVWTDQSNSAATQKSSAPGARRANIPPLCVSHVHCKGPVHTAGYFVLFLPPPPPCRLPSLPIPKVGVEDVTITTALGKKASQAGRRCLRDRKNSFCSEQCSLEASSPPLGRVSCAWGCVMGLSYADGTVLRAPCAVRNEHLVLGPRFPRIRWTRGVGVRLAGITQRLQ